MDLKSILTALAVLALASVVAVSFVAPTDAEGDYAIEQVEYSTDAEGAYVYVALSKTTEDMVEWTVSGNGEKDIEDFTFFDGPATYLDLGRELSEGTYALTIKSVEIGTLTSQFTVGEPADNATVTFIVVNEEVYTERTVPKGQTLADVPEAPEVIGVQFTGWFYNDTIVDFSTQVINEDTTVYAHFGPAAPSTEQTTKFVASLVKDEDTYKLVTTAYDEKIIGEGTATVTVLQKFDFGGYDVYIKTGGFTVDFKADATFLIKDITADISEYISSGSYAAMAEVTLDNGTTYKSSYIAFDVNGMA